jgi:alkylhydroperoxidase family enzyme
MGLPYIPNPPTNLINLDEEILRRVQVRRGARGLVAADLTLLHSPAIADGWHAFFGAINSATSLEDDIRKIAICRVALINRAWYQWEGHAASLSSCAGFDAEKMEVIKTVQPVNRGPLSEKQWSVLRYADMMTRDVIVGDDVFKGLESTGFIDREIVELTATIAAYNCVSRFLIALDVGEMNSSEDCLEQNSE